MTTKSPNIQRPCARRQILRHAPPQRSPTITIEFSKKALGIQLYWHRAIQLYVAVDVEGLAQSSGETHSAVRRWCGRRKARSSGFEKMPTAGRGVKSYE